jgi:5'-phosphate synthase pdxT subunit
VLVGVLALQGDVREHRASLESAGAEVIEVRTPRELEIIDGIVLPGGESTAIGKLLETSGLRPAMSSRLTDGMGAFGTCAGLIALSTHIEDGRDDQWSFAALDVTVRRNGYGRQIASFETPIQVSEVGEMTGVFIRAPRIIATGHEVQVLATVNRDGTDDPVVVRQGNVVGCCFHPELTSDVQLHRYFLNIVEQTSK